MKSSANPRDLEIDLLDPRLFGNEAGDDEDERTLAAYFVEKPEFKSFESDARRLAICRARKGMGKSALLNYISYSKSQIQNSIVIKVRGPDLFDELKKEPRQSHEWVASWRHAMIDVMIKEINDHTKNNTASTSLFQNNNENITNLTEVSSAIWFCIDDIDATYRRSEEEDLRLAAFFSAIRGLATELPNVRIRVSVRQDVWSSIRAIDEALDKCEQYMLDIEWSRTGTRSILAKRIKHYVALLHTQKETVGANLPDTPDEHKSRAYLHMSDVRALTFLFPQKYPWGSGVTEVYNVIHVLSAGRPRWALQLARMTAGIAAKYSDPILKYGYMKQILPKYSQYRITDLIREHSHQCSRVEDLIYSFNNSDREMSTHELISKIKNRIVDKIDVFIDRNSSKAETIDIAQFLYRVGYLEAIDLTDRTKHYHFDDSPHLLRSVTAVHDHIKWQVRPSYQAALS